VLRDGSAIADREDLEVDFAHLIMADTDVRGGDGREVEDSALLGWAAVVDFDNDAFFVIGVGDADLAAAGEGLVGPGHPGAVVDLAAGGNVMIQARSVDGGKAGLFLAHGGGLAKGRAGEKGEEQRKEQYGALHWNLLC
jgi:hypothetical protein